MGTHAAGIRRCARAENPPPGRTRARGATSHTRHARLYRHRDTIEPQTHSTRTVNMPAALHTTAAYGSLSLCMCTRGAPGRRSSSLPDMPRRSHTSHGRSPPCAAAAAAAATGATTAVRRGRHRARRRPLPARSRRGVAALPRSLLSRRGRRRSCPGSPPGASRSPRRARAAASRPWRGAACACRGRP